MTAINQAHSRTKLYGWVDLTLNFSTSADQNAPEANDVYSNRFEMNQFVFYAERLPDSVQRDHIDWGYHLTALYGTDYRFTIAKGYLSGQFARNFDAPLPGVYLSFPSAKDPDFQRRHPGKSTVEAITMLPYAAFDRWGDTRWKRRGDEYDALKERLAARLLAELKRQAPSVVGNIAHTELSTPVTTRHFMNYRHGEIYGIASTPDRFLMRELGARTPIRGLYLTGQDAASLGVVGALYGGVIGASAAAGKNFFSVVSKPRAARSLHGPRGIGAVAQRTIRAT